MRRSVVSSNLLARVLFVRASIHLHQETISLLRSTRLLYCFLAACLTFTLFNATCVAVQALGQPGPHRSQFLLYQA